MASPKYFIIGAAALFGVIGAVGWLKKRPNHVNESESLVQEISLEESSSPTPVAVIAREETPPQQMASISATLADEMPDVDRIGQLFALDSSKLPIVETVTYTSRVPWLKGRPAWIADYASHYETSRHFIARSLNRKPDYFTQKVGPGDKFNVFKKEIALKFHLLIDLSRSKMWFYAIDADANERFLLKTYKVGVGRRDPQRKSGFLTPIGKYELGEKIAIYKPGTMSFFQEQKTEMIRVFGTRWIPFEKEIEGCSEPAKGFGLHGLPWTSDPTSGALVESKMSRYDSDGCIRLAQEDIEEIFSIVITKPTTVELVRDFHEAKLPGVER